MGIEHTAAIVIGGVGAPALAEHCRAFVRELREREPEGSNVRAWGGIAAEALARSAAGELAAWWGGPSKSLDADVHAALDAWLATILAAHPDARILTMRETDHDDARTARWTERAMRGSEEGSPALVVRTQDVPGRFDRLFASYDDEDEDEAVDAPGEPTWPLRARRLVVFFGAAREAVEAATSAPALRSLREPMLAAQAAATEDTSSPVACHDGDAIDVDAFVAALAGSGVDALVLHRPSEDGTAKLVTVTRGEIIHRDLPFGLVWSPAVVDPLPSSRARVLPALPPAPPVPVRPSPHFDEVVALLVGARQIGLVEQPPFLRTAALAPAERRALLLDLFARAPEAVRELALGVVGLALERTVVVEHEDELVSLIEGLSRAHGRVADGLFGVVERAVGARGWSGAVARAVSSSPMFHGRAAHVLASTKGRFSASDVRGHALWREATRRSAQAAGLPAALAKADASERGYVDALVAIAADESMPFARDELARRLPHHASARAREAAAGTLAAWLRSPEDLDALPPHVRRERVQLAELLLLEASSAPLARAALSFALTPDSAEGVRAPRLAYRAIEVLVAAGEHVDADALPPRLAAYARRRA